MMIRILSCLFFMSLARGALAGEDRAETGETNTGTAESEKTPGWDAEPSTKDEWPPSEPSASAWDQPRQANTGNPCAGVTCSYRGQCVVSHGAPTCACYQGYTSNGLNCVPLNQTHAQERERRAENKWMSGNTDADLTVSLDGFDVSRYRAEYHHKKLKRETSLDFIGYVEDKFKSNVTGGFVMLVIGIGLAAGSLGFYLGGDSQGFRAAGVVSDVLGAALIISGSVIIGINSGRVKKLRVHRARRRTTHVRLEGIGPLISTTGLPNGLGASFSF
jgi:hypothetical protein